MMVKKLLALVIPVALLAGVFYTSPSVDVGAQEPPEPQELIEKRTRTSKTFSLGGDKYALDVSIGSIHYKDNQDDPAELWKDIDPNIQPSDKAGWDWEVVKGNWHLLIRDDTSVAVGKDGHWIGFRYEGFAYLDIETKDYVILDNRREITPTITGNKIRWENIFYGVNLEYVYANDRFKENLEITQITRDWLADNPPSSYGLNNQSSYLVGYIEVDWRNAYPAEDEIGGTIDWGVASELEGKSIFFRHPVKDYLVSALPLDWARHDDVEPENWVPIRKRFIKKDDKHWLLFGSKVTELNQLPAGTITLDPTVDEQVGASADDAIEFPDNTVQIDYVYIGATDGAGLPLYAGCRWTGVNIPSGATIDVSYSEVLLYLTARDSPDSYVYCEDGNNPGQFAENNNDISNRTFTTACANWTGSDLGAGWTQTPSLNSVIQEVVDDNSGTGDALIVIWHNQGVSEGWYARAWDYDNNTYGAKLHIEYSTNGVVAPTVVTNAATSVEETTATLSGNITATGGENCTDRGFQWDVDTGAPYADNWTEAGDYGVGNFTHGATSLPTGTTIYYIAGANNTAGWGWGSEVTFLTKPAAPTNVAATDGAHTDKVVVTWTKSTGATGYKVYEGVNLLDTLGDVATYDDSAAAAGTISAAGNVTASDGSQTAHVVLSLANEATANGASRTYKVVALNATGDSGDSGTNDGYRSVGAITYQWQMSSSDNNSDYSNIDGATTDPYNATGAPEFPAARYFQCIVSSVDASNSPQTSDADRGYRGEAPPPPPPEEDPRDPDLVYLELRPDLDETGIVKKAYVPTLVYPGIFFGYSLAVWDSDNETLYLMICVPDRWDESSDILVHVKTATTGNETGNVYTLELGWDKVTPNVPEAIPTGAPTTVTANRTVDSELTYACYRDWFTIDYDKESADPIVHDDTLAFRFRRDGGTDNLTGELIAFEFAVLFARGDLLGNPDDIITEEDMEEIGIQFGAFNNILGEWSGFFLIIFGLIFVIGLSLLAFWRYNALLFMMVAGTSLIFGFYWYDVFTTNLGLTIGITLIAYGIVCLGFALQCIFWRGRTREE